MAALLHAAGSCWATETCSVATAVASTRQAEVGVTRRQAQCECIKTPPPPHAAALHIRDAARHAAPRHATDRSFVRSRRDARVTTAAAPPCPLLVHTLLPLPHPYYLGCSTRQPIAAHTLDRLPAMLPTTLLLAAASALTTQSVRAARACKHLHLVLQVLQDLLVLTRQLHIPVGESEGATTGTGQFKRQHATQQAPIAACGQLLRCNNRPSPLTHRAGRLSRYSASTCLTARRRRAGLPAHTSPEGTVLPASTTAPAAMMDPDSTCSSRPAAAQHTRQMSESTRFMVSAAPQLPMPEASAAGRSHVQLCCAELC